MSPDAAATDQVYHHLKAEILRGRFAPTSVLNVHAIATGIGISISPIRDTMQRLVGERLLTVRSGGGFQMPAMSAEIARDLYQWHASLTRSALHSVLPANRFESLAERVREIDPDDGASLVSVTAELFDVIGDETGSVEHGIAIHAAGEKLHALRHQEMCLKNRKAELLRLVTLLCSQRNSDVRGAIAVYHSRRLRALRALVTGLYQPEARN